MPDIFRIAATTALITFAVPVILILINISSSKKDVNYEEHDCIILKLPKIHAVIGLIGFSVCIFSIVVMSLGIWTGATLWVYILALFFVSLGLYLIIATLCLKLTIDKTNKTLKYRSVFGRTKIIGFKEIKYHKFFPRIREMVLYTEKGKISIPESMINYRHIKTLINQYHIPHKRKDEKNTSENNKKQN